MVDDVGPGPTEGHTGVVAMHTPNVGRAGDMLGFHHNTEVVN